MVDTLASRSTARTVVEAEAMIALNIISLLGNSSAIPRTPDRRLSNHNETAEEEMESLQFQAIKDEKAG